MCSSKRAAARQKHERRADDRILALERMKWEHEKALRAINRRLEEARATRGLVHYTDDPDV